MNTTVAARQRQEAADRPERGRDVAAEGAHQPQLPRARRRAREQGRKVSATFVPGNLNELLMCFDFARSLPETNALQNGMRKKSGKLIMDAERDGHSEDVCTYVKADLGMMLGGEIGPTGEALPKPDILLLFVHRLLHLHEVVRADPSQVRLRDGDVARALPRRRQDRAQHARLRGEATEGNGDPDAGAHLGRQVRHRPAAPVHEGIAEGRGRPGRRAAIGQEPPLPDRRLFRRRLLHRPDLHGVPRDAGGDRVLPRAARGRSSSAYARARGRSRRTERWERRNTGWSSKGRPTGPASASSGRCSTTKAPSWSRRPTPRSAAYTTSASGTMRTVRSSRSPSIASAAIPTSTCRRGST